jgi:hypothetical protein
MTVFLYLCVPIGIISVFLTLNLVLEAWHQVVRIFCKFSKLSSARRVALLVVGAVDGVEAAMLVKELAR